MKKTYGPTENPGAMQISILLLLGFLLLDYLSSENLKTEMSNLSDDSCMSKVKSKSNLTGFVALNLFRSLPGDLMSGENETNEGQALYGCSYEPVKNPIREKGDYKSSTSNEENDLRLSLKTSNVYFY
jgi:hypothetical protein